MTCILSRRKYNEESSWKLKLKLNCNRIWKLKKNSKFIFVLIQWKNLSRKSPFYLMILIRLTRRTDYKLKEKKRVKRRQLELLVNCIAVTSVFQPETQFELDRGKSNEIFCVRRFLTRCIFYFTFPRERGNALTQIAHDILWISYGRS